VPPAIADTTNHIRNGLSGGFFSSLLNVRMRLFGFADKVMGKPS
jgi:hypothetical protein